MNLCDETPEQFVDKDLRKLKRLSLKDKCIIFDTLTYPDCTWFYHKVIGIGKEQKLDSKPKMKFFKHLCYEDLFYFTRYILGYNKIVEQPNRAMCEKVMIRKNPDIQEKRLMCEPRGTYKTTIISISYPIWRLIRNSNLSILIDSETDNQAKTIYKTCKEIMENNILLTELYGTFKSLNKTTVWNDTELNIEARTRIRRDPSLYHCGVESAINGKHPDIVVLDDPHSEQNTQTSDSVDKVDDHYKLLTPLLDQKGELNVVCTRWVQDDLAGRILKREKEDWSTISIKACYNDDGSLYAPKILTNDFLNKAKKTMGMYRFSANYLNDPKPDVDKSFKPDWLQYYNDKDLSEPEEGKYGLKDLAIYMSIDASWGDKKSTGTDPTAIVVAGFTPEGQVYILDIFNKRINPTEVVDQVFYMVKRWNPLKVASEDINTQKGINREIDIEMAKRKMYFTLDRVKHQAISKENRILGLTPIFENKNVFIRKTDFDFIEQYEAFNPSHKIKHDDILDAFEMMIAEYIDFYKVPDTTEEDFIDEEYDVYDIVTGRC